MTLFLLPSGQVQDVSVRQLNITAVNVSWSRLDSEDVFYRVYYSSPEGQVEFSGNSSWGVVRRLQGNCQTKFQVVAVVNIQGLDIEGMRSGIVCVLNGCGSDIGGSNSLSVAGVSVSVLLLIVSLTLCMCFFISIFWYRRIR